MNMFTEEIDQRGVIIENEQALREATQKQDFIMAYIYCFALVHRLLELTLKVDYSIRDCLSLLRKRCRDCLPPEQHFPKGLDYELESLVSHKERIFERLRYAGARDANHSLYGLVSEFHKKYLALKDWIGVYGQKISYREGITIPRAEGRQVDTGRLIEYFESIDPHSVLSPESIRDNLTTY